ncbi:hypothetical protein Tco_1066476 [Tanacetum coccineum]|uniref:Myb/SANT-like DNA-binding domain-containing protein n=1 Tax=Tanacetum coccineum TaxID=301880 RepID=A0ABQ5HA81_9ASTR
MDDTDSDSRYPSNYRVNQGLNSTHQPNVTVRNVPRFAGNYVDLDDDEEEDEEEQEQQVDANVTIQQNGDNEDDDDTDDDNEGEDDRQNENFHLHRHPKKRKLKSLLSSFELVPRVPTPAPLQVSPPTFKPSFGGRNALTDWTEIETFALLDSWGERFVKRGRKSLRSEEWQEVADKVAQVSRIARTDTQCRNRLDTLKKKYKKEKALLQHNKNATTKWVYFKKMDMLIAPTHEPQPVPLRQPQSHPAHLRQPQPPVIYLNSPGNTDSEEGDDDDDDEDSDVPPPKKSKIKENKGNVGSFKLLADSINRFSDVYEKIETRKRKEMLELEKMRMDLYRELELQKTQILERARAEIVKFRRGEYQDNDSARNVSG